ncbi:GNAT family N-acetyltransferase [Acidovorax sp. A1169]|uniref:GNAT family N-acetyltransferase n=1 Tax=Acidovorax sp. A1169 TaxID=3059524 RepID=UPI002737F3A5|nr:GNAT family N-acetyltransferase [Acidovorax sp. A1169]MDP4077969.1 GNAT family N-acetyltransferase [Acidovorax sp. A1169]
MNELETSFAPEVGELQHISKAVIAHDRAAVGAGHPQPLACLARDNGHLIGGAAGRIELDRLYVEYLWVDAAHRRKGLGQRLLAGIEVAAKSAGCNECLIESLSPKTALMYERAGYRGYAQIDNYIPGLTLFVLLKPLV